MKQLVLRRLGRTSPTQGRLPVSSREQPALRHSLLPVFSRDRRGSVAIEMAIVLPVMLLILIGVIQYGNIMYTQHMMVYAAREVARSYSMGEITVAEAQERALDFLSAGTPPEFDVNVVESGGATNDVTVTIDLPMAEAAIITLPHNLFDGLISAEVTMRVL